jgi:hypothetical protein
MQHSYIPFIKTLCTALVVLALGMGHEVCSQQYTQRTIRMGDDTLQLKVYEKPGRDIVYVHVHENEVAALEAGLKTWEQSGGRLVTISHSFDGTVNRNITFRHKGNTYRVDPNRIYTPDDSVLNSQIMPLKGRGKVSADVVKIVRNLADSIWHQVKDASLIVAVHNNKNTPLTTKHFWFYWYKNTAESYNVTSYVRKSDYSSDSNKSCSDIYINPAINDSEFFIVTQREDFMYFFEKRYNVVLQNQLPVDDGSMSVYASAGGKRYINAEAKMGRVEEQLFMLGLLLGME